MACDRGRDGITREITIPSSGKAVDDDDETVTYKDII